MGYAEPYGRGVCRAVYQGGFVCPVFRLPARSREKELGRDGLPYAGLSRSSQVQTLFSDRYS